VALALYRKYRPATFAEVVGQEHVTEPLRAALAAGRINHAYLFSGPRGCGKTSSARILARSLNCVHGPTPDPCGECPSCFALAPEGPGSLDVVELDAASHGGVDDTRELRDRAFYMPAESRYRVFIIDEAHMVSTQGFNALLKIVEEPPEHLVFIFATTEPEKVLTTIRSRTHHYPFRLIPPATLRALLEKLCAEEKVTVEPAVYPLVIRAGGGSARDSLSVLDQLLAGAGKEGVSYPSAVALLGVTDSALLDETVDALAAADGASVFGAVDKVVEAGHDPRRFASDLLQRLRDLMVLDAVPDAAAKGLIDVPEDELAAMAGQAERLGSATVSRMAEVVHTGLVDMRGTTAPRLVLELMCARMLLPAASTQDGALLQRLERMERRMSIAEAPRLASGQPESSDVDGDSATPAGDTDGSAGHRPGSDEPSARQPGRQFSRRSDAAGGQGADRSSPTSSTQSTASSAAGRATDRSPSGQQAPQSGSPGRAATGAASGSSLGLPTPPTLNSSRPPQSTPHRAEPDPAPDRSAAATSATDTSARAASAPAAPARDRSPDGSAPEPPGARSSAPGRGDAGAADVSTVSPAASNAAASTPAGKHPDTGGASPAPAGRPSTPQAAPAPPAAERAAQLPAADPTAPGPAPDQRQPSDVDVTDVRRVWTEVLAAVQRRRRTTQILLESATVVAASGGGLQLSMPHAGMAKRVLEPANADLLRAALHEVLGVDWVIRCDAADAADAAAGQATSSGPGDGYRSSSPSMSTGSAASATAGTRSAATTAESLGGNGSGGNRAAAPSPRGTDIRMPDPEPPSDDEPAEDIPDDYGDPEIGRPPVPQDPEQAAVSLLAAELGARRLESDT